MYQINILTNKEFDKVAKSNPRYKHVDQDNLGFADPIEKKAYIRHTAYPELNKYLIDHEFEHLLEEKGTDEDDMGIRHKKKRGFMDWLTGLSTGGLWTPSGSGLFQGGGSDKASGQQEMTPQQVSQSYQDAFGTTSNQYGNVGGNQQATQSSALQGPEIGGNLFKGGLNDQNNQQQIDPQLQQRLNGFFSGRIPF